MPIGVIVVGSSRRKYFASSARASSWKAASAVGVELEAGELGVVAELGDGLVEAR